MAQSKLDTITSSLLCGHHVHVNHAIETIDAMEIYFSVVWPYQHGIRLSMAITALSTWLCVRYSNGHTTRQHVVRVCPPCLQPLLWNFDQPVGAVVGEPVDSPLSTVIIPNDSNLNCVVPLALASAWKMLVSFTSDVAANVASKMVPTLPGKNSLNVILTNPAKVILKNCVKISVRSLIKPRVLKFVRSAYAEV